jgi:hypothetical protein
MQQRLLTGVVLGAIVVGATGFAGKAVAAPAHNAVTLWHERTQPVLATWTGRGNAAQAYTGSLVQIAVYDAVVAIRGGYRPFYAAVEAPEGANLDAAIATAAYRVARTRVNVATPARDTLDSQYAAYVAAIPDGPSKGDGIAVGEAAAAATLAARAGDNFYSTAAFTNPPADPGVWQATPVANDFATAGANDYAMAFTIPITAHSPDARRLRPSVAMDKKKYARALHEVQETGGRTSAARTTEMTDAVQFWTESGFTLWTRNTRDIVIARGLDERDSARATTSTTRRRTPTRRRTQGSGRRPRWRTTTPPPARTTTRWRSRSRSRPARPAPAASGPRSPWTGRSTRGPCWRCRRPVARRVLFAPRR